MANFIPCEAGFTPSSSPCTAMVASLAGIPLDARLRAANATTRYYVEHAVPPAREQLIAQMEQSGF